MSYWSVSERHFLVVRLLDQVDYSELRDHLAEANMTLVDIVWGHWDLMWGIHFEERLPHDMGLHPKAGAARTDHRAMFIVLMLGLGVVAVPAGLFARRRREAGSGVG